MHPGQKIEAELCESPHSSFVGADYYTLRMLWSNLCAEFEAYHYYLCLCEIAHMYAVGLKYLCNMILFRLYCDVVGTNFFYSCDLQTCILLQSRVVKGPRQKKDSRYLLATTILQQEQISSYSSNLAKVA